MEQIRSHRKELEGNRMTSTRSRWPLLLMCMVVSMGRSDVDSVHAQSPADPACFDNAAWHYWKAMAKIQPLLSRDHFDTVLFAESRLPVLPPKVFAYYPEAGRWLIQEKGLLAELQRAGAAPTCFFNPPPSPGRRVDYSHRDILRSVWWRALGAAKALEFAEQHESAVAVYIDLFRLLDHLDGDGDWASAYLATTWLPELIGALEGYFSRLPPRLAVQSLADYLGERRTRPLYPMREFMETEMRTYAGWLRGDPARSEQRLATLYRDRQSMPAIEKLLGLDEEAKREKLTHWLDQYEKEVTRLGASLEEPYSRAVEAIRLSDKRILIMKNTPKAPDTNPLLPLLMPPMTQTYQEFVAAEASVWLVELMALASIYRDFVGDWPDNTDMIEQFARRTFPPDPFTGKPIDFTVRRGIPRSAVAIPPWLEEKGSVFAEFDLGRRVDRDEAALNRWIRYRSEARAASAPAQRPVPEDESDERARSRKARR